MASQIENLDIIILDIPLLAEERVGMDTTAKEWINGIVACD